MGEESLEAEQRGLNHLHLLAFSLRNDADEISKANQKLDAGPSVGRAQAAKLRVRGQSFLEKDMRTRKKEILTSVFALSDKEYEKIK